MADRAKGPPLDKLGERLRGRVIDVTDPAYDNARSVNNSLFDRRPLAIVQCVGVRDVQEVVTFAAEWNLPVTIRGGGHSGAGHGIGDAGLAIDLARFRQVRIDAARGLAIVGGGATYERLVHALQPFALTTPVANCPGVGIAGMTLGGGFGYMSRRFGLCSDNLLSVDLVTAEGGQLVVDADSDPGLLWALRGGGGNFGVVTSMTFRLHPFTQILGGVLVYDAACAQEVLTRFREVFAVAGRDLGGFFRFYRLPRSPQSPAEWWDRPVCVIAVCHLGDPDVGSRAVEPLLALRPGLLFHNVDLRSQVSLQQSLDVATPRGLHRLWRSEIIEELSDDVIALHAKYAPHVPSFSTVHALEIDGAVQDLAPESTAFPHRDGGWVTLVASAYRSPAEAESCDLWAEEYSRELKRHANGKTYVNFLMSEGPDRVKAAYLGNYQRLTEIKTARDPANMFRGNQNLARL